MRGIRCLRMLLFVVATVAATGTAIATIATAHNSCLSRRYHRQLSE